MQELTINLSNNSRLRGISHPSSINGLFTSVVEIGYLGELSFGDVGLGNGFD